MVSISSDDDAWLGRRISFIDFSRKLEQRRGDVDLADDSKLRNAGNNRTESKKALLAALDALGAKW